MKKASPLSVGIALAIGLGNIISAPAAIAKKEKPAEGPKIEVSKEFRAALVPIETDIKAAKYDGVVAKLDAAAAVYKLPDEQFIIGGRRYDFGKATANSVEQRKGVVGMVESKSSLVTNIAQLNMVAGQFAFAASDYPDAIARLSENIRLGGKEPDTFIRLAEASYKIGKNPDFYAYAKRAIVEQKALGQKAPIDWYRRAVSIAFTEKNKARIAEWAALQVADYQTPENWRAALLTYKDANKLDGQISLDVMRLLRVAKALAGEGDFGEYAGLAVDRGLPGEVKSVIDEGRAAGTISKTSRGLNELLASASNKIAGDLSSLAASEKQAPNAATGKVAASTADAYLGYGQDTKAIALYKLALQKGQIDVDTINTRLGIAYTHLGQKAEARSAFTAVTGSRSEIAKFWLLWLNSLS